MPLSHYINGHPIYIDGPIRLDLTPADMLQHGFVIREHRTPGKWCYWHRNPHGPGECFGAPHDTVDDAIKDARWQLTAKCYQTPGQLKLLEVAA